MARVKDWINGFLARHKARFDPHDWPEGPEDYCEFLRGWVTALATNEVTEAEADAASLKLVETPPRFRPDHVPAVVAVVKAERQRVGGAAMMTREAAELASRDCERCCGMGMVTVWHPDPDPRRKIPPTVAAHCVCPAGRWMRDRLARGEDGDLWMRRIPDLARILAGGTGWLTEEPGTRDYGAAAERDDRERINREWA